MGYTALPQLHATPAAAAAGLPPAASPSSGLIPPGLLPSPIHPLQHNKQREELHRLQAKHPQQAARLARGQAGGGAGDQSSSSSDDDDVDEASVMPEKTQAQIFETLLKIRRRDPSVYDANATFYSSSSSEDEGDDDDGGGGGEAPGGRRRSAPITVLLPSADACGHALPLLLHSLHCTTSHSRA